MRVTRKAFGVPVQWEYESPILLGFFSVFDPSGQLLAKYPTVAPVTRGRAARLGQAASSGSIREALYEARRWRSLLAARTTASTAFLTLTLLAVALFVAGFSIGRNVERSMYLVIAGSFVILVSCVYLARYTNRQILRRYGQLIAEIEARQPSLVGKGAAGRIRSTSDLMREVSRIRRLAIESYSGDPKLTSLLDAIDALNSHLGVESKEWREREPMAKSLVAGLVPYIATLASEADRISSSRGQPDAPQSDADRATRAVSADELSRSIEQLTSLTVSSANRRGVRLPKALQAGHDT